VMRVSLQAAASMFSSELGKPHSVIQYGRFQVLTAASIMFRAVFWVDNHSTRSITQKTALNVQYGSLEIGI
jgi:hypothetical protein